MLGWGGEVIGDLILWESEERRGAREVDLGAFYIFRDEYGQGAEEATKKVPSQMEKYKKLWRQQWHGGCWLEC
jgi:hypothetical protein